jgi:hypothetical protein
MPLIRSSWARSTGSASAMACRVVSVKITKAGWDAALAVSSRQVFRAARSSSSKGASQPM